MKQIFYFILLLLLSLRGYSQNMLMFKDAILPKPKTTDTLIVKWNKTQPDYKSLSSTEQQFYYWTNYSRAYPSLFFDSVVKPIIEIYPQLKGPNSVSLENDLKTLRSLPLLALNPALLKMAAFHAGDITSHDANPSHTSTTGETFVDRFKRFSLKNCGGENISYGAPNIDPVFMLVLLYLDINVSDLGHRKALLNPAFLNTGLAAYTYKNGNIFIVEDFACVQN